MNMKSIITATAALVSVAVGRHNHKWMQKHEEPLVLKTEKKLRKPQVESNNWCLWENDDDRWCISTTPPFLKIGWDNIQTFNDFTQEDRDNDDFFPVKWYEYRLSIWAEAQAYLQSQFYIYALYLNEFQAYINSFTANVFFSVIFNGDG